MELSTDRQNNKARRKICEALLEMGIANGLSASVC
jgi:hypothetical protein